MIIDKIIGMIIMMHIRWKVEREVNRKVNVDTEGIDISILLILLCFVIICFGEI